MTLPLSIEEQKRMVRGHEAMLLAIDKLVKAEKDVKLFPMSDNYKRAYKAAYTHLKEVAANEKQYLIGQQKEIF